METELSYRGGIAGALAPFALFLGGVAWLGISGAPNERGFWPIQIAALTLAMLLARDRRAASQTQTLQASTKAAKSLRSPSLIMYSGCHWTPMQKR